MRIKSLLMACAAMVVGAGIVPDAVNPVSPAAANAAPMKIAHVVPPGDPRDLGAHRFKELIESDKRCSITATVYPSAQLGSATDLIEAMQIGSVEAVVLPASFLVGFEPLIGLLDFPYFFPTDVTALLKTFEGPAMKALLAATSEQGVVSLGVWHTGYKQWTANKPLKAPADYAGLKARVMPSPVLVEQQKLLGLNPVNMPFPETYNALQNGTIDAQENPLVTTHVMKFHEVQKHVTMTYHGNLDQLFMVSKAWYQGLTPDCQTAVKEASDKASELVVAKTEEMTKTAIADFEKRGVVFNTLTDAEFKALREATLPGVEAFFLKQTGDRGKAHLEAFKTELGLK